MFHAMILTENNYAVRLRLLALFGNLGTLDNLDASCNTVSDMQ